MHYRSLAATGFAATAFLASLFASGAARADEACGDQLCPKGFRCETFEVGCPDIACREGAECPPSTCEDEVEYGCVPLECASDADCADGMVCVTETRSDCSDAAPCVDTPEGGGCEPAPPGDCTTVSQSFCAPRWLLPCEIASDCGAGFTCEPTQIRSCSGSDGGGGTEPSPGATPPSDPDAMPAPEERVAPPEDCVTEEGPPACTAPERACSADSDCPADWSCEDNLEGSCWASSDGTSGCETPDPAQLCYPPYWNVYAGGIAEDGAAGGPRGEDDDVLTPPSSPPAADGASDGDENGSTSTEAGGCSLGGTQPRPGAALFAFLALALAGFARRRRF